MSENLMIYSTCSNQTVEITATINQLNIIGEYSRPFTRINIMCIEQRLLSIWDEI